jgi:GH43 family beta-xylosidase
MLLHNNFYYLLYTTGGDVQVSKSSSIAGPWPSSGTVVYSPASGQKELWAPELHFINGAFYIYVAWDDGTNANHRMHVLKGSSTTDPTQPFTHVGQITSPDNNWAIDGTVLLYQNGKNYFIWSGWANSNSGNTQNLYIAEMDSPTHISSNRVLLHQPTPSWQQSLLNGNVMGINEGPEILVHNGRTFLVYCVFSFHLR